jgi:hypothetical protein
MQKAWRRTVRDAAVTGTVAAVLSTAVLAAAGRREAGSAFAPTNATSRWLYGEEEAASVDGPTARHTLVGYAIHHGASIFWALVYELLFGTEAARRGAIVTPLVKGLAVSGLACFVDYQLTPRRLQPGYELRLSKPALAGVYLAFGVGLGLGAVVNARATGPLARRPSHWSP